MCSIKELEKILKEQVVAQRREGKTIREIARGLGTSSRTVLAILKNNELTEIKAELTAKEKEKRDMLQSNYTKALRLFSKGKGVLDVTIKLGITSAEAKKAYVDFRDLRTCDQFGRVYYQFKEYLPALLPLYKTIIENGLSSNDAHLALEYAKNRVKAEAELESLSRLVVDLQAEEQMHTRKLIPPMVDFALQLPARDPEGSLISQNLSFKLSVSKLIDELGLS
jgi:hypothetical protein